MRDIVSNQFRHNGGIARIEQDSAGHLFVTCSGCRSEDYVAGMAPALGRLVSDHPGTQVGR
ncbi:hypothetical protein ACFV84_35260 [Kitasatospora sp. NPDC059811]|uniref:hypothetical protein n=1 Tax=Streptomycetaceae TaxID=2062 RepID=UPI0007AF9CDC|nr:hypothetical protein [Streptomyces sp. MJM8645]